MSHITLPKGTGRQVVGGIVFIDGVADAQLGPNQRRFFDAIGAEVTEPAQAVPDAADLNSLTVAELRSLAADEGLTVPAKARKADIVDLISGHQEV